MTAWMNIEMKHSSWKGWNDVSQMNSPSAHIKKNKGTIKTQRFADIRC